MSSEPNITQLLVAWGNGDQAAVPGDKVMDELAEI